MRIPLLSFLFFSFFFDFLLCFAIGRDVLPRLAAYGPVISDYDPSSVMSSSQVLEYGIVGGTKASAGLVRPPTEFDLILYFFVPEGPDFTMSWSPVLQSIDGLCRIN